MAVTALSGQRWQGLSGVSTVTLTENFPSPTTLTWGTTGSIVTIASNEIQNSGYSGAAPDYFVYTDLGSGINITDNDFRLRLKLYNGTGIGYWQFGFGDNTTSLNTNGSMTGDMLCGSINNNPSALGYPRIEDVIDGAHHEVATGGADSGFNGNPIYTELEYTYSTGVLTQKSFTNSDYSTGQIGSTLSTTITASNYAGLRYLVIGSFTASGRSLTGSTADNIELRYSVTGTSDKSTVTDVPIGSEFEQTDDYKSYQWGGSADGLGSSANATNNGATANVATAIDGKASLDFDGSNDWINLGTPLNAVIDGEALSVSAWVYVTATDITDQTIIGKQIAGYSSPYHVFNFRAHSGDWAFTTNDGSSYTGDATTAISHTGWTHIIATFDGTDEFKVYADNVEVCSATVSGTNWSSSYWSLGNGEGTTRWWDSTIQDVAFWSRVLTSGERAILLNGYLHGTATSDTNTGLVATSISTAGLRAYYTLNDTTAGVKNSAVGWVERGTAI